MQESPKDKSSTELPKPEVLQPHSVDKQEVAQKTTTDTPNSKEALKAKARRTTYRPSHKATFIGLAIVIAVLGINGAIVSFFILGQSSSSDEGVNRSEVTIDPSVLDDLGVSRNPVGNTGTELEVGPDATFNGGVTISGNTTIAGQLTLNSVFTAAEGRFTALQGGETSLSELTVNGDSTLSGLALRETLDVAGASRFQGAVTVNQLLTVNNNTNITGSLAVGGTLSVRELHVTNFVSDANLTIGGHIITQGSSPSVSSGAGIGANGTVSISGNDAAGTVAVNVGTGGGNGMLAQINFTRQYTNTPHVMVTAVGRSAGSVYVNRSASGFSIYVGNALSPGGYAFDYIIAQ